SAPVLGASTLPVRVRILLAALIAWLLPVLPGAPAVDLLSGEALLISIYQILIGVAMGFILQLVFAVFVVAGQNIAMAMGLGFASAVDPQNGVQVPVVSQAFLILVTLVFLALNGHLLLIELLADSFRLLPVGVLRPEPDQLWQIALWGSYMFAGGLLVALPAVTGLLLVNIAFGVAARASPQLNIFAVGFPVMILAGFLLILVLLPGVGDHLGDMMSDAFQLMRQLLVN
ncbi:MAG TPA: flagellar biosynthetic protein FliR, partial [Chromatiaceae bacterium]|nr:flagellar biosynthetic protein FliR [Chromatiaceae bacterium]